MHWSQFFSIIWNKFLYTFWQELKSFYERSFYCVCLKSKTLCTCQFSPSSLFSPWRFRNICEFAAKKIFRRPSNSQYNSAICYYKRKFFWSILFLNMSLQRGIPQRLLNKCSHLCIYKLLKQTFSSGQKPVKSDMKTNCLTAIFHFGHVFVFCRLESGSQLPKYLCYLLQWKPDKNDGKCFLSHLKVIFLHQDIFLFLLTFWSCRKNCLIRKYS